MPARLYQLQRLQHEQGGQGVSEMHIDALEALIANVRKRISEGDHPTTAPQSVETLEQMVDDLARLWHSASNYVAENSTFPQRVAFANGRVVEIRMQPTGLPYLAVGWSEPSRG